MNSGESSKQSNPANIKCFKCLGNGHVQFECPNEAVCLRCKGTGHLAAECKDSTKKLRMFGFGVPSTHGEATEDKIDKELKKN